MKRTEEEINEQVNKAWDNINAGRSAWPGMSYEQGVQAALDWALGNDDDPPMEDE